ncbi:MAG: FGGY-family carbohydrate kinase [Pseudomonadota bacterium]
MSRDLLIGIDAGTSVIKAVAFDLAGRQVGIASTRNSYDTLPGGGVEQDMDATWTRTAGVLRDLAAVVEGLADRVLALAVTAQGDGTWLVDADGRPVHKGWLWLDARTAATAESLAASPAMAAVYNATGTGLNACQMRTHLVWMKTHAPALLQTAATAFHCKDWLYLQLTGVRATDPTEGAGIFGDFRTRAYSDAVFAALDLEDLQGLLPPIVDGAAEAHALTAQAAAATGLPAGLPVCLGQLDVMCTAMGAGMFDRKTAPGVTILGSTGMHMRFVPDAGAVALNAGQSGYTMPFPGTAFAQMQTNMAATLNIDWVLGLAQEILAANGVARSAGDLFDGLDARVLAARPGAALYHPYISVAGERGPFVESRARASLTGLDQTVGWFDIVRSVYDGLVLAARDCYAAMGPVPSEIRIAGGAAQSGALRKLLAAGLGSPVRTVTQGEAGAAGACMMAAVQQGLFRDIDAATEAWILPLLGPVEAPDPALAPLYDALFDAYRATRTALPPIWQAQTALRGTA